jgi:hypothetical protein
MGANCEKSNSLSWCIKAEKFLDQLLKEAIRLQSLLQIRYSRNKLYLFPGIRGILFVEFNYKWNMQMQDFVFCEVVFVCRSSG